VAGVSFEAASKVYGDGTRALDKLDLTIEDGEFMVLVGPSGCGKTTALRMVAGLEEISEGVVKIGDRVVNGLSPKNRDIAMVFQSYALYPHMSVRDNLAYGLKVRRTDTATIARQVASVAEALDIGNLLDRRPAQLSGGQRQRVALGRAIVRQANAFLLDEPLSNLDPSLRAQARAELRRLHRQLGITVVYVTHDQEEAMTLSGRIAVMRDGAIEQVAPPLEVYARPANTFVAGFIGAPAMNLLPAAIAAVDAPAGAVAGIRPQDVQVGTEGGRRATVDLVEPRGPDYVLHLRLDGSSTPLLAVVSGATAPAVGAGVFVTLPADRLHLFDQRDGRRLSGR